MGILTQEELDAKKNSLLICNSKRYASLQRKDSTMKKILALLFTTVLCLNLVACGATSSSSGSDSSGVDKSSPANNDLDVSGEWYDATTAQRLNLFNDATLEHHRSNSSSQPGYWKVNGNLIELNSSTIRNDLTITTYANDTTLVNDEYMFMRWAALPKERLSIGETGRTENISFTLQDISFTTNLPQIILGSLPSWLVEKQHYPLDENTVFAKISVDVFNQSQQVIDIPEMNMMLDIVLDYNSGYHYTTHDNSCCYFVSENNYIICRPGSQTSHNGQSITVAPLQTESIDIYLPCPEIIARDESAPLFVTILSHYESQVYYYEYSIR